MFGFLDRDRPSAVRHPNGALSLQEFARLSAALAHQFEAGGLRPGDRVALLQPNSLELLCAYYACLFAGTVAVPINERLAPPEIARIIDHSGARLLVTTHAGVASNLTPSFADLNVLRVDEIHRWPAVSGDRPMPDRPEWPVDHPAILFYTSGSTGAPKGALYSHRTLIDNARVYGNATGITSADYSVLCHCMASNFVFAQLTVPFLDRGAIVEVVDFGNVAQTLAAIDAGATFLSLIPWFGFQLIEAAREGCTSPTI